MPRERERLVSKIRVLKQHVFRIQVHTAEKTKAKHIHKYALTVYTLGLNFARSEILSIFFAENQLLKQLCVLAYLVIKFFLFWCNSPRWAKASSFTRLIDHTQRRTTIGRTPPNE